MKNILKLIKIFQNEQGTLLNKDLSVHFWPLKIEAYLHKNLVCTNCYESIHCIYLSLSRVNKLQCRTFEAFLVLYSFEHLD